MKQTELRIGNIVKFKGNDVYQKVSCLLDNRRVYSKDWDCSESELEGIPLTPEIVLVAGFVKAKNVEYSKIYDVEGGNIFIINYVDGIFQAAVYGAELRFVHQLQNLYFALFGHELDLKSIL